MASMAAKSCNVMNISTCSLMSPSVLVQEKASRNKRKYRADPPLSDLNGVISLPPNDCSVYEFSAEKFEVSPVPLQVSAFELYKVHQDTCEGLKLGLGLPTPMIMPEVEDVEADEFEDADWSDLTETQLEELALSNLNTIFKSAIKKIVACGYTEEVASKAILRSGLYYGSKDMLTNVVNNSLAFLRNILPMDPQNHFGDLQQLEKYILAEMVCVLREIRPFFSIGDAMWCLLICDMNVSHACAMDGESLSGFLGTGGFNGDQPKENSDTKTEEISCSTLGGLDKENTKLTLETPKKSFSASGTSQVHDVSEKPKKNLSSINKREYILRQKALHLGKSSLAHLCKGSSRGVKHSSLSGSFLDKKTKPGSDSVAGNLKSASLKISCKMNGVDVSQNNDAFSAMPKTSVASTSPSVNASSPTFSATNTELSLSLTPKSNSKSLPKDQWFPQDKKDERILNLIPRVQELQNQLQEWTEWANQKVMQAARRLGKDKAELKMLRHEKEEVERLKKEKQTLQESTLKKLAEMENALCKAGGQVERANSAVRRLEVENMCLRREMEAAKVHAAESAANYHEVSKREKKTLLKFQSWEKQKKLFQEELKSEKVRLVKLLHEVDHAKNLRDQLEAKWRHELKAKEDLSIKTDTTRKEREEAEAFTKSKEETIRREAETNMHRFRDEIQNLEREISDLRQKADSSKIAALKRGVYGSYSSRVGSIESNKTSRAYKESSLAPPKKKEAVADFGDWFGGSGGGGGVKRERECVMCLSEETCVVFIPCAHQVVCRNCNELHEKQGMKDCPSCRSCIQRRITVRYAPAPC